MNLTRKFVRIATVLVLLSSVDMAVAQEVNGTNSTLAKPMSDELRPVTQKRLDGADKEKADWLHVNGGYSQTRYFRGRQINNGNIRKLRPAFIFQTGVLESMQTAPLVVDGAMFLTTSNNHVFAIDARTR